MMGVLGDLKEKVMPSQAAPAAADADAVRPAAAAETKTAEVAKPALDQAAGAVEAAAADGAAGVEAGVKAPQDQGAAAPKEDEGEEDFGQGNKEDLDTYSSRR